MSRPEKLGDLQLAILRVLWSQGESSVNDVHAALREDRALALTTIATMLKKMEHKGLVEHRAEGRKFLYRPAVSEQEVTRSMVDDLTSRLFDGDAAALVAHLLERHEIDPEELPELREMIARAKEDGKRGS